MIHYFQQSVNSATFLIQSRFFINSQIDRARIEKIQVSAFEKIQHQYILLQTSLTDQA
jgi:hypothetical protein